MKFKNINKTKLFFAWLDSTIILIVALTLYALASDAYADTPSSSYEFPRNIECASLEAMSDLLEGNYGETLLFTGTSMNKVEGSAVSMFITVNKDTSTYTFVNYYNNNNIACIIDSGKIKPYIPSKPKTPAQKL